MTASGTGLHRAVIPLFVGILLGFIGGYFAGGGGRPALSGPPKAGRGEEPDRTGEIRNALEKDPENPRLLTLLGNALYDREDWDGAIRAYEKARRKAGSDPNLLSDLGAAYRNRGEFKRAVACFEKARASDPDHWQSLLNLVLVDAFDIHDAGEARRHFAQLKRRYPEIPNLDKIEKQIAMDRPG